MVRPVDISRYQEAVALCKLDYLVLCDGAAVCALEVKWVSGQQRKVRVCLHFYTSLCHMVWEKWNHAIAARLCLWYVSHGEGGWVRQSRAVFRECIGTNSTDIKVGVCFFPAQRGSSFIPVCDLRSLWSCHTGHDPSWLMKKAPPVCRHSKVLTTDGPYPHFDRSLVHPQ